MKKILLTVACLSLLALVPGCRRDRDYDYENGRGTRYYTKEKTYTKSRKGEPVRTRRVSEGGEPVRTRRVSKEFAEERPMKARPMPSGEATY